MGKPRLVMVLLGGAIALVIAWAYYEKTRPIVPPVVLSPQSVPSSAFFQFNPIINWAQDDLKKRIDEAGARRQRKQMIRQTQTFLTISTWAAQPQPTYAAGPFVELAFRDAVEADHLKGMTACHILMNFNPAAWESLDTVSAVGHGPAGPLAAVAALAAQPKLRALIREQDDDIVIVATHRGNSAFSTQGGVNRKSDEQTLWGTAAHADRGFGKLRSQLEDKLRELGGTLNDPAETLDGGRLVGFSFNYTLGSYRGRVEAKLESSGSDIYKAQLDMEEKSE